MAQWLVWISEREWFSKWNALADQLNRIEGRLRTLTREGRIEMATLVDVIAEVRRTTGVVASVKVAVDGLKAKIADLSAQLAAAIAANDPVALQAVVEELDAANDALDALVPAVEANPGP